VVLKLWRCACEPTRKRAPQAHRVFTGSRGRSARRCENRKAGPA
jgi:hypothetical protein